MDRTAYALFIFALIGMFNIVYRIPAYTCCRVGQAVAVGSIGISVIFCAVVFPASADQVVYCITRTSVFIACRCVRSTGFGRAAKVTGLVVGAAGDI